MPFYVYILANSLDDDLYKGFTEDPCKRLTQHNTGQSQFTSSKTGWYFIFLRLFSSKKEALIYEKRIKRLNKRSLFKLIDSGENMIKDILAS